MPDVYRLEVFDAKGNSHGVGTRTENWRLVKDKEFADDAEARDYVRAKNRLTSSLPNFLVLIADEATKEAFVDEFCFSDRWIAERRYFLGKPDVRGIQRGLERAGVRFVKA